MKEPDAQGAYTATGSGINPKTFKVGGSWKSKQIPRQRLIEQIKHIRSAHHREDKQLKPATVQLLNDTIASSTEGFKPSQQLVKDLIGSVKATTANSYAPHWQAWASFAKAKDSNPIPAQKWVVADFLSTSSQRELSFANSAKRLAAINFFHSILGIQEPGSYDVVTRTLAGIKRRVSRPVRKREAVTSDDISNARRIAMQKADYEGIFLADCGSIMHEAQLRLDDLRSILVGDIVWESTHATFVITDAKTDTLNQGQIGLLAQSENPSSAFQRLLTLLKKGIQSLSQAPAAVKASWKLFLEQNKEGGGRIGYNHADVNGVITLPGISTEIMARCEVPVANLPLCGRWLWAPPETITGKDLTTPISAAVFHKGIVRIFKNSCPHLERVGAHSFRHGGTSEKIAMGISHEVVQLMGRWREPKSLEGYINPETSALVCVKALQSAAASAAMDSRKMVHPTTTTARKDNNNQNPSIRRSGRKKRQAAKLQQNT